MKIIDAHTHCFTDSIVERAMAKLSVAIPYPPAHDGTVAGLINAQLEAGVDISVMAPIATKPSQNEHINEWAASVQSDKLRCMGSVHPKTENYKEVIDKIAALGLVGIKFHPEYQDYYIDDENVIPIYEYAAFKGLPMLFHAGADIAYKPPYKAPPKSCAKLARRLPGAKIICAHLGGNWVYDEALEELENTNVYIDLAATCFDVTGDRLKNFILAYGTHRVMFATDSPWTPPKKGVQVLNECGLSTQQLEQVFYKTAESVFGI